MQHRPIDSVRIAGLTCLVLLVHGESRAQHSIHPPDLLPRIRHSPLLATPEQAKLDESTGSLAYQYAIAVPPGTGGATPALVLSYSSLTQATEYGWGWSLGLGRIERSTRSGPPSYGPGDEFELDGERLVRDPRPNRFHRERTQFERIEFMPDSGGGWWQVIAPDGTRLHFGSRPQANSRFANPNEATADGDPSTPDVFQWLLDEVFDPRGNSWRVEYEAVPGFEGEPIHLYPLRIDYSFHEGGAIAPKQASRRVEFAWHERRANAGESPDLPTSYRGGFLDQTTRRLAAITTSVDGATVARWEMSYHAKTSAAQPENPPFSQLASIRRFAASGEPFAAPTTFEYTPQRLTGTDLGPVGLPAASADRLLYSALRDSSSVSAVSVDSRYSLSGLYDLDGDGLLDRLGVDIRTSPYRWEVMFGRYPDASNPARFRAKVPWKWYDASGAFSELVPADAGGLLGELDCADTDCNTIYGLDWSEVQILDLDGDGLADLVDVLHAPRADDPSAEDRNAPVVAWKVWHSRGDGFAAPVLWSPPSHAVDNARFPMLGRTLGASSGGRYSLHPVYSLSRLIDVDGDGRPDDLLAVDPDTWSIALNAGCDPQGRCGFASAFEIHSELLTTAIVDGQPLGGLSTRSADGVTSMEQADVQGDGLPDLIEGSGGCVVVFPSVLQLDRFDGGVTAGAWTCGLPSIPLHGPHSAMRDVNGDGWLDLLDYGTRSTEEGSANAYLGLGDGSFSTQPIPVATRTCAENCGGIDLDSDGLDEDVYTTGGIERPTRPLETQWHIRDRGARPGLLREIRHERGSVTAIEWQSSARFVNSPARAASPELADEDHRGSPVGLSRRHYWVVSRIGVSDGRAAGATPEQVRAIRYAQPRYDWRSRENLGLRMSEVTEDPEGTSVVTRSFFHQKLELRGLLQFQETLTRTPASCATACREDVLRGLEMRWRVYVPITDDASGVPIPGASFAAPYEELRWARDPQTGARQTKTLQREFGWLDGASGEHRTRFGNLVSERDGGPDGDPSTLGDNGLLTEIEYSPSTQAGRWLVSLPAELRQRAGDGSGALLGRMRWIYDGAGGAEPWKVPPSRGLATEIRALAGEAVELAERFAYDGDPGSSAPLGHLTAHWDANAVAAGAGPTLSIEYDAEFRTFAASSINALGHRQHYRVDPRTGSVARHLDPNGRLLCSQSDGFGRPTAVREHSAPQSSIASDCDRTLAQFFYRDFSPGSVSVDEQQIQEVRWAVPQPGTPPEDRCNAAEPDCIASVRFLDGLAREYFDAVEAEKTAPAGSAGRWFRRRTEWGARGELICSWFPERGGSLPPAYERDCAASTSADRRVFAYDALLRPIAQHHAGQLERSAAYGIEEHDGVAGPELVERILVVAGPSERSRDLYREIARDRDGAVVSLCGSPQGDGRCPADRSAHTVVTLDAKKRVARIDGPDIALDGGAGINPNIVSMSYDLADRRAELVRWISPSQGATWQWTYDANGNVVRAVDPRGSAGEVRYAYDALGRLLFKDLPPHSSRAYREGDSRQPGDVALRYDEPGDLARGFGRNLGKLTAEHGDALERRHDSSADHRRQRSTSSFRVGSSRHEFAIESEFDSLGRPKERVFPDGERLRFAYTGGVSGSVGLVRSGETQAVELFRGIRAHPSGAIEAFTHAGPGVSVTRTYDLAQAQRLSAIEVSANGTLQRQLYSRDRAGNPLEIRSGTAVVEQQFWYDGLQRLVRSVDARGPGGVAAVTEYAYDDAGNLTRKGDAVLAYGGVGALPDAVTSVRSPANSTGGPTADDPCPSFEGEDPTNDPNGDGIPTECQCGDLTGDGRIDVADIVSEGRCIFQPSHAGYCNAPRCDANGDGRCDVRDLVAINQAIFSGRSFALSCALRPEGQPISPAGDRYERAPNGALVVREVAGEGRTALRWDAEGHLIELSGANAATYAYGADGERISENSGGSIRLFVSPEYEVDLTAGRHEKHVFLMGRREISIAQGGIGSSPANAAGAVGERWLHHFSDPLGSLLWTGDERGAVLQHAALGPYGEVIALTDAEGRVGDPPVTPFLFTGHRFDAGVGLHAMGARDYDPRIGAFLSVDPAWLDGESVAALTDGAVHLNAFAYASGQPTRRIDPDGRLDIDFTVTIGSYTRSSSSRRSDYSPLPKNGCNWMGDCTRLRFDPSKHIIVNFGGDYHGTKVLGMGLDAFPKIPIEMVYGLQDGSLFMDDCERNWAHCPLNFPAGTREHFVDPTTAKLRLYEVIDSVQEGEDPYAYGFRVGMALHAYSDSTPHGPYRWYTLGHVPRDLAAMGWNATLGRIPGARRFKMTDEFDPANPDHRRQMLNDQRAINRAARRYCAKNPCP